MPAAYRADLRAGVFVTRGMEECIWVLPIATWNAVSTTLRQTRVFSSRSRLRDRLLFPGSVMKLDKQGRIWLPPSLRAFAGLEENGPVMVVGVNNRVELWNCERWLDQQRSAMAELKEAMDDLEYSPTGPPEEDV